MNKGNNFKRTMFAKVIMRDFMGSGLNQKKNFFSSIFQNAGLAYRMYKMTK